MALWNKSKIYHAQEHYSILGQSNQRFDSVEWQIGVVWGLKYCTQLQPWR